MKTSTTTLYIIIIFLLSPFLTSIISSQNTTCNTTPYPSFCKTTLPSDYLSIHEQTLFFLQQSLSITKTILQLISSYLNQSTIPNSTLLVLQDCLNLAELNTDLLSTVIETVSNSTNSDTNIFSNQVYDLQTLLSAVITNHQTCLDGFHDVNPYPRIRTTLSNPLSDGVKLYSTSLALFTHGWVSNDVTSSSIEKTITVNNRKLLQTSVDNVIVTQKVVVNPDGSGDFVTINDAVDAAPNKTGTNNEYHVIHVVAGVYSEYVSIGKNKENLMIVGDGIDRTVITGDRSVVDGWTTFQSATFAVIGKGFVAVNMTFRNTAGSSKHQAVAVRNGADMSVFYNCSFEGYQDTLYAHSLRQFYKNCNIYGTVDFIFGNAAAVFQNCNMYPRLPMQNQFNAITAQGRTDPNQNTGFSIWNCYIVAASELGGANSNYNDIKTYLGRPWKEYSRTIYMQCFIDGLVDPKGWIEWLGDFALSTLYYGEFGNWGEGSSTSNRVTWEGYHLIDGKDADEFTVYKFIHGDKWLPMTGVPFRAGFQ
ncbi:probable pectinesterase/pectinesterase inhibitor 41 [Vicia villosa]|uniref:probable pectinesterase/pectinesterase inhibitor 41 n=1 Tax=Vicia villosa TaxID=3911 RepID=UPI00273AF730|nr:probable pectinesterase/pectinesterase inhibitor 41 [Vicia villosa]